MLMLCTGAQAQVNINVRNAEKSTEVSPMLYGIFYEDINHAADGGLYAELIRNRSFEDDDTLSAWSVRKNSKNANKIVQNCGL